MVAITYVAADGARRTVEAREGDSLMQTAVANDIEGIVGECGGSAMCATCHVYVDAAFADRLPPMDAVEDGMLENTAAERKPSSRLSCQIRASAALEGLVVHMPDTQR